MIVRISSKGSSFKGLAAYLTHDPDKAQTAERVAWTHTMNCANDDVNSAVNEMYWTAEDAELLKQEAGIRAGGRSTDNPVKHVSLNWSPKDDPTREHMIEASGSFLKHMGWDGHQVVIVAHDDKSYKHCHLMLNAIHPETGLKLNDSFEQRRAQEWALQYERSQENIRCEQRLKDIPDREDGPTRPAWMAFKEKQKEFENAEKSFRENDFNKPENQKNPENAHAAEWKRLKDLQREEREQFFQGGKSAFSECRSSVYSEVREEFRGRWKDFYVARKDGGDADQLASMKEALIAEQKARLDSRRDEACQNLRDNRDGFYRELLQNQQEARLDLRSCLEGGRDTSHLFPSAQERDASADITAAYRENAETLTGRQDSPEREAFVEASGNEDAGLDNAVDQGAGVGFGVGWGLLSFAHSVFIEFEGSKAITRPRADPAESKPFELAAEEARRNQERQRRTEDEEERERRQKERCIGD